MSSLKNMIQAMKPIKMYSLKNYTTVYKELNCYASALDLLSDFADEIISECFLSTASDYGLALYERLSGCERTDLPLETRRNMLIKGQMLGYNDNTLQGILNFFSSVGLECDITEVPDIFDLYIMPKGREYSDEEQKYIIKMAELFLPCHLSFLIDFRTVDWNYYDNLNLTFDGIDDKKMSWNDFEKYKEEA